ncbi:glucuronyl esterase domain-containing protein [Sorangium sp. So ce406]|uniref:glucuronyl esterase domain-containing protein n=1 Tax=Sorangium sp. So ce406 TaxID=3133311 RepID=UPI003F5C06A8
MVRSPAGPTRSPSREWSGTVLGSYRDKVNVVQADTHSLVAMYAPRGLLVLDNSRIGELGSVAQHAATAAGGEVYKAPGAEENVA